MKHAIVGALVLVTATLPAAAAMRRHHHQAPQSGGAGMPITAEPGSIRINGVGQVLSQPVPVIQKEKRFEDRARRDLSRSPQQTIPNTAPTQQSLPNTMAAPQP